MWNKVMNDRQKLEAIQEYLNRLAQELGIASASRHFTSSALERSRGVWPSWFFRVGSAPWARRRAQSWVRPF